MGIFDAASLPSGPTSKGTTDSSVASWAQPYINQYLTGAQNLVNQGGQPNALMQQSYTGAANLKTPEQFGQATNLAQQGGQGLLGTTGTALGYGSQAAGAGQNYANMATNPNAIQAYMNPYIQQSLAPQLALLNQQQALQGQDIAAKAVGQGAFGGNRATLAQGLNAQNFDLARQQAIGQGYNNAFNAAQQAQQYGAGLGLQGLNTALQGVNTAQQGYSGANQAAATLGQLGSAQNQANLGILGAQNQFGQQQYNLPYQNLQFMQGMMAGLPFSNQTQQGWQAPPNALSQMTGLTGSLLTGGALANKLGLLPKFGSGSNNTNPYAASQENNGAQTGETWGSPGVTDSSYENLGQSSVMSNDWDPNTLAEGGPVQSYASGGIVSLAMKKALKG